MLRLMLRRLSLLHVRGGVSPDSVPKWRPAESSPRPWRCFRLRSAEKDQVRVFSTSVEVFPSTSSPEGSEGCLLHVRGGVSSFTCFSMNDAKSSPRPWRCFLKLVD